MAGSAMTFSYEDSADGAGIIGGVRRIVIAWTSDSVTGSVVGTTRKLVGELVKAVTIPGAGGVAPTANYDPVITDADAVDVLGNADKDIQNRSATVTEEVNFFLKNAAAAAMARGPRVCSPLTITVSNAGNSKQGQIILYMR